MPRAAIVGRVNESVINEPLARIIASGGAGAEIGAANGIGLYAVTRNPALTSAKRSSNGAEHARD
jgi:hypothetical protein